MNKPVSVQLTQQSTHPRSPVSPATAGVNTLSEHISVTNDASMNDPVLETSAIAPTASLPLAQTIPEKLSPRKQTALTTFYTHQPLHIIRSNRKAHNSQKRKVKKLSSSLPSYQQLKATTMASLPNAPTSPNPHSMVQIKKKMPSEQQIIDMASLLNISKGQVEQAWQLFLNFEGYSHAFVTPSSGTKRKTVINVDDSPESPLNSILTRTTEAPLNDMSTYTEFFNSGTNWWIPDKHVLTVLNKRYKFGQTTLSLNQEHDKLKFIYTLAAQILGTTPSDDQSRTLCAGDASDDNDPYTRFKLAEILTIQADDVRKHLPNPPLGLQDVLLGKRGPLYSTDNNSVPPTGCVILMKLRGNISNTKAQRYEHAIFLPDTLLLITANNYPDKKDGERQRVRNAWQIREVFRNYIMLAHHEQQISICNRRIAGRIFGNGDTSTATLVRAAVLSTANLNVA